MLLLVASDFIAPFFGGVLACVILQFGHNVQRDASNRKRTKKEKAALQVSVVGNICSGKSTALKRFQEDAPDDTSIALEPISDWEPMLHGMATTIEAWIDLQISAASFYATLKATENTTVFMTERDLMSVALFAGNRPSIEQLLLALAEVGRIIMPHVVVHIDTPWETCYERVLNSGNSRGQAGDEYARQCGAEFFRALNERHKSLMEWYANNGCLILSVSSADAAVIALREAREQALAIHSDSPPRYVTRAKMKLLLNQLWPIIDMPSYAMDTSMNNID